MGDLKNGMDKHTKIIATIGPASYGRHIIHKLSRAGMNAARINMSHGDRPSHNTYIENIRSLGDDFPIIIDTKGPEIRTGPMTIDPFQAVEGTMLQLTNEPVAGTHDSISVTYPYLNDIPKGTRILFDDGLVETETIAKTDGQLSVRVLTSGPIGVGKKVTIQGYRVRLPFLTESDKHDIRFAIQMGIRLVAASFVRSAEDVHVLKAFLDRHDAHIKIFSKIEHREAVENLAEILSVSDGIMIARGDLGVEMPLQDVPRIQERIIRQCNRAGKPVIVATQMLESMRENPRPTRAEVSDVAHAIFQGTDAIMLSAETATGKYPVRAVEMMRTIAHEYEDRAKGVIIKHPRKEHAGRPKIAQFIAKAAFYASEEFEARAILTPTESGFTARNVSRFKPKCPILAVTRDRAVMQFLHLVRGVFPMLDSDACLDLSHYAMSSHLLEKYYTLGILTLSDRVIIISGSNLMTKRGTNLLEIYTVGDIIEDNTDSCGP